MSNETTPVRSSDVALPAQGQCSWCAGAGYWDPLGYNTPCPVCRGTGRGGSRGAPDSRSETFSPREWPTLAAVRRDLESVRERHDEDLNRDAFYALLKADDVLEELIVLQRRRRPRGESEKLNDRQRGTSNDG